MWDVVVFGARRGYQGVLGSALFDELQVRSLDAAVVAGVQYVVANMIDISHIGEIRTRCVAGEGAFPST